MVLKAGNLPPQAEVKTAAPGGFETDTNATPEQVASAAASATTAIATAQATSLAASGPMKQILAEYKDVITGIDFGTLPRLTGSNGNIMDNDKALLGEFIELQLVSWNEQYVVSPGDDSAEAKALVRYSKDGKVIEETGELVTAYLEKLRTVDGYAKASKKQYYELIGVLEKSAKKSALVTQMVQVSLSPQSRKFFDGYLIQRSVAVKMGRASEAGSEFLRVTAVVKTDGTKSYTLLKVTAKDAPVDA